MDTNDGNFNRYQTNSDPVSLNTKNIPRCACTQITHLPVIAFPFHDVYTRCSDRGFTEYNVHHYFATTHSAVVRNFIVCKSATSVTGIFLWRHHVTTFCFLKSIDWPTQQTFTMPKKMDSCGQGVNVTEKEESFVLTLTLKWNVFTITAYKVVVLSVYSFSIHLQPIDTNLSINWYW